MSLSISLKQKLDTADHHFRVYAPHQASPWLQLIAQEYGNLRTECILPVNDILDDGIQSFASDVIKERIKRSSIPKKRSKGRGNSSNFDVVRSDFGETLCYMILSQEYGTKFGYKGIRDRETIQQPGRGIDAIGVEEGNLLTLVLGEVKVSSDKESPPQVVDKSSDCLQNQHKDHIGDLDKTIDKLWNSFRQARDISTRDLFAKAFLLLEYQRWDKLQLVACCFLVRPDNLHKITDFGSFINQPDQYVPAKIRFIINTLPEDIDSTVNEWYQSANS
jgi:hypothetical protein